MDRDDLQNIGNNSKNNNQETNFSDLKLVIIVKRKNI